MAPSLVTTFSPFILQYTPCIWNKTTIQNAIAALSEADIPPPSKTVAHMLLKLLSKSHAEFFVSLIPSLADWIINEASLASPNRNREDKEAVEDILKALSRLGDLRLAESKDFVNALKTFALEGETEGQGRRATTILLKLKRPTVHATELVKVFLS
jgi:hypothetical protein